MTTDIASNIGDGSVQSEQQSGRGRGKRQKVSSSDHESPLKQGAPGMEVGGPSSPKKWPQPGVSISLDQSDVEQNLMDISPTKTTEDETIFETPTSQNQKQPDIEQGDGDEEGEGEEGEEDMEIVIQDREEEKVMSEEELRHIQKGNVVKLLGQLRMKPEDIFRMHIPLCRLVAMPMVRPALASDIAKLEQEFAGGGYQDGAAVFYVSPTNEDGNTEEFTQEEMESWDSDWKERNEVFTQKLESKPELHFLKNLKLFICDGNHRRIAWMNYISKHKKEYCNVDSILLDTKGKNELVMQVMHDVNKTVEDSHVKTNLVHTLYQVQKYGMLPIAKFAALLRPAERKRCLEHKVTKKWYSIQPEVFTSFIFRQEISQAADAAVRRYMEATQETGSKPAAAAEAMRLGAKERTKNAMVKMFKLLAVANPANGEDFLKEVEKHWGNYEVPEMTLEKLQLVATCKMTAKHKTKILQWWNSSTLSREAWKLPPKPVSELLLPQFLVKCTWYAGIEDGVADFFNKIVKDDNLSINYNTQPPAEQLSEYIEGWRQKIWEHGFMNYFKGQKYFKKGQTFSSHEGSAAVVRRVLYRYFKLELEKKGAIASKDLPQFLPRLLDRNSSSCMFSPHQLRTYTTAHLSGAGWYLDCTLDFTHNSEVELRASLEGKGIIDLKNVDEFTGMGDDERKKAINRRDALDRKKEVKNQLIVEAKEKKQAEKEAKKAEKEAEKAEKEAEKEKDDKTKAKGKKKAEEKSQVLTSSPTGQTEGGVPRKVTISQLTEDVISRVTQVMVLSDDDVPKTEDLILNNCIEDIASDMEDKRQGAYDEVLNYLVKMAVGKTCMFEGVANARAGVDVIFIDCPENLPVPGISLTSKEVPDWNADLAADALQSACNFAVEHLHDDGCIIVFHSFSIASRENLAGICEAFDFKKKKDWLGMNRMHLTSPMDTTKTTQKFGVTLLVKDLKSKGESKFAFKKSEMMRKAGVDVENDDMLMNYMHADDISMNGKKPWRGAREKDPRFFTLLLEATSSEGDVIVDCTASTGACIIACRGTGRNILAFEGDKDIFNAILKPMKKTSTPVAVAPTPEAAVDLTMDGQDVTIVPRKFVRKGKSKVVD